MRIKKEIRILGIDDGPFDKYKDKRILVVGTVYRGGSYLDGILSTTVSIDGRNATLRITEMIKQSKFYSQIKVICLNGIAVGGFNVIDVQKLYQETKIPVLIIMRNYPRYEKIFLALRKIRMEKKIKLIASLPEPERIHGLYTQSFGLEKSDISTLLKLTCIHSQIPEPLRIAHIIAAGVVRGESYGNA